MCPECQHGNYSACWGFLDGRLAPGIHTGNSRDATGGFAEYLPAHRSMVFPVPDDVPDELAVLADPFSVSLHAITRNPPPTNGRAVVYGAGALGTTATAILRALCAKPFSSSCQPPCLGDVKPLSAPRTRRATGSAAALSQAKAPNP